MSDNVFPLPGSGFTTLDEDQRTIVRLIEEALEEARAGRYRCFALCGVLQDGAMASAFRASTNAEMVGCIQYLDHRVKLRCWTDP